MRRVAEPADASSAESLASNPNTELCNYLIWAAIFSTDEPILKLANLSVFLSEPIEESHLVTRDSSLHKDLVKRAWTKLEQLQEPCNSFHRLPAFAKLLGVTDFFVTADSPIAGSAVLPQNPSKAITRHPETQPCQQFSLCSNPQ